MARPNPLKTDPSRTAGIRRRWLAEVRKRVARLEALIWELVVTEDAFGLGEPSNMSLLGVTANSVPDYVVTAVSPYVDTSRIVVNAARQRWRFLTNAQKIEEFKKWLKEQVDRGELIVDPEFVDEPWNADYVRSAYKQGLVRSYADVQKAYARSEEFYEGGKAQFLRDAFDSPQAVDSIRLLYTRAYDKLKTVHAEFEGDVSRVLADGLAHGRAPRDIARELKKATGTTRWKAERIARTEVIHAHAEGQLDSLERLGVEDVGVMVEWQVAAGACPLCSAMSGVVLKVTEARGLIPRHPNCRCAFVPWLAGISSTRGVKRNRESISKAITKSVKAERKKKRTAKEARDNSVWVGAGRRISAKRNPGRDKPRGKKRARRR